MFDALAIYVRDFSADTLLLILDKNKSLSWKS